MTHPSRLAGSDPGLQALLDDLVTPMGFEVVCATWSGQGKYRVLRLFIDRLPPAQVADPSPSDSTNPEPGSAPQSAGASQDPGPQPLRAAPNPELVRSEVSLQDCTDVSRMLSLALDAAEQDPEWAAVAGQFKAAYTLEVSSPGIERPLTKPEHFQRFCGHLAAIRCETTLPQDPGRKNYSGRLTGLLAPQSPDPVVQLMDQQLQTPVEIPISAIRKAHLLYEGRI